MQVIRKGEVWKMRIVENAVIVKKSSPKNLSADRRPTGFARNIGYLSDDSQPTVGRLLVMCR